ncbi:hypothetical protein GCM10018779_59130 [Streptomyces griseocarneus]|nr:hypothetical protein GCM10018779_59130 [Streptomyces griseocarneus]
MPECRISPRPCAEMGAALEASGGIASPRLLGKIRGFQRAAARVDGIAARECGERIRETVRGGST